MRGKALLVGIVFLTLTLSAWSVQASGHRPSANPVPSRVPPDQVPEELNVAGVSVQVPTSGSEGHGEGLVSRRVPENEVPDHVNKVAVNVQVPAGTSAIRWLQGTITYTYGFYWFQYSPDAVAVAGFAQTKTNFCAQRLFARVKLYNDVQHDGTWEFKEVEQSEATGACVVDSGEARTGFWTAPNGTDWMVRTSHLAQWNGRTDTWNGQKVGSFP